jgi:hypothetical protein
VSNSAGNPSGLDCSGVMLFDMGARIASGVDPRLHAGATIFAQFWTRDALAAAVRDEPHRRDPLHDRA